MTTYGPFYPAVIDAGGWSNASNAKLEDAAVSVAQGTAPELRANTFNATVPSDERVKRVKIGVKVGCSSPGSTNMAIDTLQLQLSGVDVGDSAVHGDPVGESLAWHEYWINGLDLSASDVNSAAFGVYAAWYDSNGMGEDGETRVDAIRITIEAE